MWEARNKTDLIIEVWERLDCESIGRVEIEAIETAVEARYGKAAVDSPMVIARLLADEGAVLRHAEIMELYVERASDRPYDAAFRGILKFDDLRSALRSIRDLTNLRKQYQREQDKEGLRLARIAGVESREALAARVRAGNEQAAEIDAWLRIWLETPEIFEDWVAVRMRSKDFIERFGDTAESVSE